MNPYTGGICPFFRIASTFLAFSAWVTPGGSVPFSGRSSIVIANFCPTHKPASKVEKKTSSTLLRKINPSRFFMRRVYFTSGGQNVQGEGPYGVKSRPPEGMLSRKPVLVPSKGLEPPHRCRYMDLNHARLPIPPRWQSELQCSGGPKGRRVRKTNPSIFAACYQPVKPRL